MIYFCCDERRRSAVRLVNGIDWLVVHKRASALAGALAPPDHDLILVRCFHPVPTTLTRDNVQIEALGGIPIEVFDAAPLKSALETLPGQPDFDIPDPSFYFYVITPPGALGMAIRFLLTLVESSSEADLAPFDGFRNAVARIEFFDQPRGMRHSTTNADARDFVRDYNGIDYIEVVDSEAEIKSDRQRILRVYLIKPVRKGRLNRDNVRIEGGERTRNIAVVRATLEASPTLASPPETSPPPSSPPDPPPDLSSPPETLLPESPFESNLLVVEVDRPGDFSIYTLRLTSASGNPLSDFDPLLSAVDFSFKVECPNDFDCKTDNVCPPEPFDEPEIDYLAKDYASFRQLMLDRFSVLMPQWTERNTADLGVTLVEMLAYVGDHLSYRQDAVATEAYLGTARRRASVRRHARLVDYVMHDGSNARVWVRFGVEQGIDSMKLARGAQLFTRVPRLDTRIAAGSNDYSEARTAQPEFFETMHDATLYHTHNEISFYTWGERECCLPKGATRATLRDRETADSRLRLRAGDILIFQERLGPDTGDEADADLSHRHVVRLTRVEPEATSDFVNGEDRRTPSAIVRDPLTEQPVVEIEWAIEDALPFPLCLSAMTETTHKLINNVSVALGNIVLADHGRTVLNESLEPVSAPDARLAVVGASGGDCCEESAPVPLPPRFRPRLKEKPLTFAATVTRTENIEGRQRRLAFDPASSAASVYAWDMRYVLPAATLEVVGTSGGTWRPQRDLLASDEFAPEFVAEVEEDGAATLRFGDDEYGMRPAAGTVFGATYRVGNGVRGNIGAESLAHIVSTDPRIVALTNPLPGRGGVDAESIEDVRKSAPSAFRTQERAVTTDDYAEVAQRHPQVQRAAATVRWTGSWRTIFLTVDRLGGRGIDADFETEMRAHMERYRMAGQDVEIDGPQYVPLEIEMEICVKPNYFRSDVLTALLEVFSNQTLIDGRRGIFNPDNFTFGQTVYLSQLYAAAQSIEGVHFVEIKKLQRFGIDSTNALDEGRLLIGRLEIARLDNNPNFPENGVLRLTMEGGR